MKTAELAPLFFVPPPFRQADHDKSTAEFAAFLDVLRPDRAGRRWFGFVAGLLKSIETPRENSVALHLRHFARPIWSHPTQATRFAQTLLETGEGAGHPTAILMKVSREEGRNGPWLKLDELAAMPLVDERCWIPGGTPAERALVARLVAEGRTFRKPLAPALDPATLCPVVILEDRHDRVHLEREPEEDEEGNETRSALERRYADLGQAVAWWTPGSDGTLPPPSAERPNGESAFGRGEKRRSS